MYAFPNACIGLPMDSLLDTLALGQALGFKVYEGIYFKK